MSGGSPYPWPSLNEQYAQKIEARLIRLKEAAEKLTEAGMREMTDSDLDKSGLQGVGCYIRELRHSRDTWERIATDRSNQLAQREADIRAELIAELRKTLDSLA